jgi:hypothetical protein
MIGPLCRYAAMPLCRYAAPPIAHHRTYGSDLAWVCTRIRNLSLGGPVPAEALFFWATAL